MTVVALNDLFTLTMNWSPTRSVAVDYILNISFRPIPVVRTNVDFYIRVQKRIV